MPYSVQSLDSRRVAVLPRSARQTNTGAPAGGLRLEIEHMTHGWFDVDGLAIVPASQPRVRESRTAELRTGLVTRHDEQLH
jgi:hypothetical protein